MAELLLTFFLIFVLMAAIGSVCEYLPVVIKRQRAGKRPVAICAPMKSDVDGCPDSYESKGVAGLSRYRRAVFFDNYFNEAC